MKKVQSREGFFKKQLYSKKTFFGGLLKPWTAEIKSQIINSIYRKLDLKTLKNTFWRFFFSFDILLINILN